MNKLFVPAVFAIGLAAVTWVAMGFVGASPLALMMTLVIAGVYLLGARELQQFRLATATLTASLADIPEPLGHLEPWLQRVDPSLQTAVRLRISGERVALPGPALTPYLVGLLVMLGMLGTFLGMIVTFKGVLFALDLSADLQAIRSALAAPIQGLGLAFGTSVAGVAASSMLGLMSAVSRRERVNTAKQLDACISTVLRPFSQAHQREETLKALQMQAKALPEVVGHLQTMMAQMENRNQRLNEQLMLRQDKFHGEVTLAYTGLASAVSQSLTDSLVSSAIVAGETIKPVVEAAMTELANESRRQHEHVSETVQAQLLAIGTEFGATARSVSDGWQAALHQHEHTNDALVQGLDRALTSFTDRFEERSNELLSAASTSATQAQADHLAADQQRLQAWTEHLASTAAQLHSEWQLVGEKDRAGQETMWKTLQTTAAEISVRSTEQVKEAMDAVGHLLEQGEALIQSRIKADANWTREQGDRMDQLAGLWRKELGTLREEESERGRAAVARLGELQEAVSRQLATLGAALEEPLSRLMQTASEAPEAAAALITRLRQEMTRLSERDNLALEDRVGLMARISALVETTDGNAREQRAAIESMVDAAAAVMDNAGKQFTQMLGTQTDKAADMVAHVSCSAIELATLGESFHHAVELFNEGNDKMMASLQRVEGALSQSSQRSDEQLAYYVGQAREVIDLSLSSQRAVVEDLRRLHGKQVAQAEGVV